MFSFFKYYNKKYILLSLLVLLFIVVEVILDLQIPQYMSQIVNLITSGTSSMNEIMILGLKMLGIVGFGIISSILSSFILAYLGSGFIAKMREEVFKKISELSQAEINKFSTASLITRTIHDLGNVRQLITEVSRVIVIAPIMATIATIKMIEKSASLSIATLIAILLILIVIIIVFVFVIPKFKVMQKLTDRINLISREHITGVRVIRAYNTENFQEGRFNQASEEHGKTYLFVNRSMGLLSPIANTIFSGLTLFFYWFGATLISTQVINLGDLMAFTQYSMMVLMSIIMFTMVFVTLPRTIISIKRVNEVLKCESSIIFPTAGIEKNNAELIEFKNVNFKYPKAKEYVLKDISFTAKKDQVIAIIGSTGSGKSTLAELIARIYDVTEGEILIDGINIKEFKKESFSNIIGYVPQKAMLFSGTIEENIKYGKPDSTDEEMKKASSIAQADNFIENFEEKYSYNLSQSAINLSGGQKQRLSIARAIIKKSSIFIFDDCFSALDYKTDKSLRDALKKEAKDAIKIFIAQRVGTIRDADQIIVLEKGEMVGLGTHEELLNKCEVYKEIALSQLSEEEL